MPSFSYVPTLLSPDVESVRNFPTFEAFVEWLARSSETRYDNKKEVPCWLAGPCKTPQALDKGVSSVSCLVLDVDASTPPEVLQSALAGLAYVAHTTYSSTPQDRRWRVILPTSGPISSGQLRQVYRSFAYPLAKARGLSVDTACINPARKWLVPCTSPSMGVPPPWQRGEGAPLDVQELTANPWAATMRRVPEGGRDNALFDLVRDAKRAKATGEQLAELRQAALEAGLDEAAVDSKFTRAADGTIGGPGRAQADGFSGDADPVAFLDRVIGRVDITRDVRTGELLLRGERVTDTQVNEWARTAFQTVESRRLQPEPMAKLARQWLRDYSQPVDRAREALESFVWDGKPRLDRIFQTYWGCEDNAVSQAVGGLWVIGLVGKIVGDKRAIPFVPIIHGVENTGKSLVTKALMGALGPGTLADSIAADKLESRDMAVALARVVCVELAELTSLLRNTVKTNEIKNFITSTHMVARCLYKDDEAVEYHRACGFIGTTNEERFVRGTDGNRRLPILMLSAETEARDVEMMKGKEAAAAERERNARLRIDLMRRDAPQLWAEALVRYLELWPEGADMGEAGTIVSLPNIGAVNEQANRFLLTRPEYDTLFEEVVERKQNRFLLDDGRDMIPLRFLTAQAVERRLGGNAYLEVEKTALRAGWDKTEAIYQGKRVKGFVKKGEEKCATRAAEPSAAVVN